MSRGRVVIGLVIGLGAALPTARAHGDDDCGTSGDDHDVQRTGLVVRLYGQGLAGYYGDAFYRIGESPVISEAAFGFGALIGAEFSSRFMIGVWGEWLFGGIDTDSFADIDGFSQPEASRASLGASMRLALFEGTGLRPYVGVDGQYMLQFIRVTSQSGVRVPVRSWRTGQIVGFGILPDAELESRHTGWGIGPVFGLRWKLTPRDAPHVDLFAEGAVVHEWWSADGVDGFARRNRASAQAVADAIEATQLEPTAWTTTVRIGIQFGP
jgi:hypothetical protein